MVFGMYPKVEVKTLFSSAAQISSFSAGSVFVGNTNTVRAPTNNGSYSLSLNLATGERGTWRVWNSNCYKGNHQYFPCNEVQFPADNSLWVGGSNNTGISIPFEVKAPVGISLTYPNKASTTTDALTAGSNSGVTLTAETTNARTCTATCATGDCTGSSPQTVSRTISSGLWSPVFDGVVKSNLNSTTTYSVTCSN